MAQERSSPGPITRVAAVALSDSVVIDPTRAIFINTAATDLNLKVRFAEGGTFTLIIGPHNRGTWIPMAVDMVFSTGTTVSAASSNILAGY